MRRSRPSRAEGGDGPDDAGVTHGGEAADVDDGRLAELGHVGEQEGVRLVGPEFGGDSGEVGFAAQAFGEDHVGTGVEVGLDRSMVASMPSTPAASVRAQTMKPLPRASRAALAVATSRRSGRWGRGSCRRGGRSVWERPGLRCGSRQRRGVYSWTVRVSISVSPKPVSASARTGRPSERDLLDDIAELVEGQQADVGDAEAWR